MENPDEYLVERITKLEEENEELERKVRKCKRGFLFRETFAAIVLITLVFALVGGVSGGYSAGADGVRNDKCIGWCTSHQNTFTTPGAYEDCFKQCDNWYEE